MAPRRWCCHNSVVALMLLTAAALVLSVTGQTEDIQITMDVCPAGSLHRSLPFLKLARAPPGALSDLLGGGLGDLDTTAIVDFAKKTLIPMLGANVVFLALALLFILIFLLWRALRFCCHIICCRTSCDARREERNPHVLLFGSGMKVIKVR